MLIPTMQKAQPEAALVTDHRQPDDNGTPRTDDSIAAAQLWQTVLADLRGELTSNAYRNFFQDTSLTAVDDNRAIVTAPNTFTASTLQTRYSTQVERAIHNVIGERLHVEFVSRGSGDRAANTPRPPRPASRNRTSGDSKHQEAKNQTQQGLGTRQLELDNAGHHGLNPRLTYETYVVGSSNRFAHAASLAVADQPGGTFNPLFVHGGVGLGKTHLLHAIGHRAIATNSDLNIVYVSSETFTNDLIKAIMAQRMEEFRGRYRTIDILMIDDIQFIAGKESTQEEFFHTFNALYQNGKQVVISSDRPPKSISALEDRLRSRFEGGLIADVQLPDYEMRTAILRTKANELGVSLPDDLIEYVAHRDQSNIRELEGALNKILMMAQLYNRKLDVQLAMESLTESSMNQRRATTTAADVLRVVCEVFGVTEKELLGRQRKRQIVRPRHVAMYLLREETGSSLAEIGRTLGGRDHTTVLHGIENIEKGLNTDTQLRSQIIAVQESLLTGKS
ncbi:MAG: chromosomal replication initiator protein DnaA [Chloroflexota bacterium]|jgi:chromosomal replication initiator protein|nr:chromosomal replication initiator protein DnaA [Chloroflexota bacterium]